MLLVIAGTALTCHAIHRVRRLLETAWRNLSTRQHTPLIAAEVG